jgi:hypothetical protein
LLSSSGTKWITHVTVLTAELARLFQREMWRSSRLDQAVVFYVALRRAHWSWLDDRSGLIWALSCNNLFKTRERNSASCSCMHKIQQNAVESVKS